MLINIFRNHFGLNVFFGHISHIPIMDLHQFAFELQLYTKQRLSSFVLLILLKRKIQNLRLQADFKWIFGSSLA